jgi:glycosyltransferase involved in cell wall biosynthesis
MPVQGRIAVVVTTYNRPDALALVLDGYAAQTDRDFELIVADDGSTEDTRRVVEGFAAGAPFPVRHVWQSDYGFRAAAIRNRAIAATEAAYIIFTDGDCVPATDFVARHRALAEPGWFLAGNRALLTEPFTRAVIDARTPIHRWSGLQWLSAWLARSINRLAPLTRLPDGAWRRGQPARWEGVKTCNLSAYREDLLRVNGLDEQYAGWGLEDSDLVIRLLHAGVRHKTARFACAAFHLWHRENDRSRLAENRTRLAALLASDRTRAEIGVDRYLPTVAEPLATAPGVTD